MTDTPNKIIPNSFQTPNFFVDELMQLLLPSEFMCMSVIARKTFGWQKRSDRISKQQVVDVTGLNTETVDNCMSTLVEFGIVIRVRENNAANNGVEWALQLDDQKVRVDLLEQRKAEREAKQRERTQKARDTRLQKGVGVSNTPTQEALSVGQKTGRWGIVEQTGGGGIGQTGVGGFNNPHKSHLKPIKNT